MEGRGDFTVKRNSLWKKIISVLLTAAMVMTAVPVSASGFETEETDRTGFSAVSEESETDTFRKEIPGTESGEFLQSDTSDGNESDTSDGNEPDSSTDEEEPDTPVQEENALQKMIDEAEVGAAIQVPQGGVDISGSEPGLCIDKNITLDLAGQTITAANGNSNDKGIGSIQVKSGATLTLTDSGNGGKIVSNSAYDAAHGGGVIQVSQGSHFVMNDGTIDTAMEDPVNEGQFGVTVMGTGASVEINGGTIRAGWYAVSGNGSPGCGGTTITINSGELISTGDYAIYHPQVGTLRINGGTISGAAGAVSMNGGSLEVNNGTLQYTGDGNTGDWGDGTGGDGNAVFSFGAEYNPVNVVLNNGRFIAVPDDGSILNDKFRNDHPEITNKEFCINGGYFKSAKDLNEELGDYLDKDSTFYEGNVVNQNVVVDGSEGYRESMEDALKDIANKGSGEFWVRRDFTESFTIVENKTVTLNLSGHTIKNEEGKPVITNNGTLTINGEGTIKNSGNSGCTIQNYGTLTINSGTIENSENSGCTIENYGTLIITGGRFEGGQSAIENGDGGQVTITGGWFSHDVNDFCGVGYLWDASTKTVIECSHTVSFYVPYSDMTAPGEELVPHKGTFTPQDPVVTEGYTFDGWYKDAACTEKWKAADTVTEDLTLYAKITKTAEGVVPVEVPAISGENPPAVGEDPVVGLDTGGGISSDSSKAQDQIADIAEQVLNLKQPVPEDVVFLNDSGTEIESPEKIAEIRKNLNADRDKVRVRVQITHNSLMPPEERKEFLQNVEGLTVPVNAETAFLDIDIQIVDGNDKVVAKITHTAQPLTFTIILPENLKNQWIQVVREHGTEKALLPEDDIERETDRMTISTDKFSTYALVGTAEAHTVTFKGNGGSLSGNTVAVVKNGERLNTYPTASRSGYTFTGWYTNAACTDYWRTDSVFTSDKTLYAGWEKYIPPTPVYYYTVTFDSQGGSAVEDLARVREWTHISEPEAPVRDGYVFEGWYKESTCVTPWDFAKDYVTSDITLYAKWTEEEPELVIPEAPKVEVVSKTSSQVKISWEPVEGADGYTVWVREEDSTEYVRRYIHYGNIDCEYTRKNLDPGTKYFFIVRSWVQDEDGKYHFSELSDTVRGTTKPEQAKIKEIVVNANGDIKVRLEEPTPGATHYAMCWSRHEDYSIYKIGIRTIYPTRTIAKGMAKGTYYVKVRPYRQLENSRVYADWAEVPVKVTVK